MKPGAEIVSGLLSMQGVKRVVVSPGSRNAPLIASLQRNKALTLIDVIDERSAAFIALGIAGQSREPVALVCTSGTALLNYAPAIAEAYYQEVPLIVLSADRPMQWIDQDDSQTIRQVGAMENYVKGSFDIPDFPVSDKEMSWYASRTINEALSLAKSPECGPVHINMQFNAPLTDDKIIDFLPRKVSLIHGERVISRLEAYLLAEQLVDKKVLVIAGYLSPQHKLTRVLSRFRKLRNVALLPEAMANLHLPGLGGIDRILTGVDEERLNQLLPDVVITIGGALLSRKVKEWLRMAPPAMEHWSLSQDDRLADCFCHLTKKFTTDACDFFRKTGSAISSRNPSVDYSRQWAEAMNSANESAQEFLQEVSWSDFLAHSMIFRALPSDWMICCSNGTSIRYAELFASYKQYQICCNRGTSGIEGCTSTAVGKAMMYSGHTVLITGDMSLLHDMAGFASPKVPERFKIIVFRNGGGDIFRFITSTSCVEGREQHFTCKELCQTNIRGLAATYGYDYLQVESAEELKEVLPAFIASPVKTILEISTICADNASILRAYMTRVKQK